MFAAILTAKFVLLYSNVFVKEIINTKLNKYLNVVFQTTFYMQNFIEIS